MEIPSIIKVIRRYVSRIHSILDTNAGVFTKNAIFIITIRNTIPSPVNMVHTFCLYKLRVLVF